MAVKSLSTPHDLAPRPSTAEVAGIAAVDRALRVLQAFGEGDRGLTLGELSRRTGLYKSALSRIMATLIQHRFALRHEDGRYGLGPALHRLGGLYERSVDLNGALSPALQALAQETGESASFYIRQGDRRLCLMRVDGRRQVRDHIPIGSLLPLDRGAAGRVLTAFATDGDHPPRPAAVATTIGERDPELAAVAAPVFGAAQRLIGALCVAGTATRFSEAERLSSIEDLVLQEATRLTLVLGGDATVFSRGGANSAKRRDRRQA
jgi:DNA-binding IclR family transcriptional regulator